MILLNCKKIPQDKQNHFSLDWKIIVMIFQYMFNIDTIRHNFKKPSIASSCDGFLEIFRGSGSNWSFVEPGDNYSVIRTTEKDPISNLCSNGLYFFRSHIQFQDAFRSLNKTDMVKGEFYILLFIIA